MGIVSSAMLIICGVYLTLGLMYLRFWFDERSRRDYLAFSLACISYALFALLELGMMTAETPQEYVFFTWWAYFPGNLGLIFFAWVIHLHFRGKKWLFRTFCSLRLLTVGLHLFMPMGIHFSEITGIGSRTVLGETLSYPISVPNPFMALSHLGHILMILFFLDASLRHWRRGGRQQALIFGTGTILFGTTILILGPLVLWGLLPIPIISSFAVLFFVGPMLYELNYDMHRAAMLSEKLEEGEGRLRNTLQQLQLSVTAGNVGLWTREVGRDDMWASERAREIWGFPNGGDFSREDLFKRVHPADREMFITASRGVDAKRNEFNFGYRIQPDDGNVRWIHTSGKVEQADDGSAVVHGAIVDITKLKQTELRLADTYENLQLAAAAGSVGLWTRSTDGEIIWANEKAGEIWGFPSGDGFTQNDLIEKLHPGDHERVMECVRGLASGKEDYRIEFRIEAEDGNIRWIHSSGKVDEDDGSRIVRGALVDITKLRLAEGAVRELSGRLIDAQERERARVALELHDDINQKIALLAIHVGGLQNEPKDLVYIKNELGRLVSSLQQLSKSVHRISHELHPGKLAQLGLEATLRGHCRELSAVHPLEIDFEAHDVPRDLPADVSLCLFRATQESLTNVLKHSGATNASVSISRQVNEILLTVHDDGHGFDPAVASVKGGLGLISINERARHVNGKASVTSTPGEGATVKVQIPLDQES